MGVRGALADTTKIKHSNVTGKEALLDVLRTINTQFDDLLNASYHQDGQKLLVTNRYLQKRFDSPTSSIDAPSVNDIGNTVKTHDDSNDVISASSTNDNSSEESSIKL